MPAACKPASRLTFDNCAHFTAILIHCMSLPPSRIRDRLRALRLRFQNRDEGGGSTELPQVLDLLEELVDQIESERLTASNRLQRSWLEQRRLDQRISALESSPVFRLPRSIGFKTRPYRLKLANLVHQSPLGRLYQRLHPDRSYESWTVQQEARTPSLEWHGQQARQWRHQPLISVILVTRTGKREWLDVAIKSVFAQTYPSWELCICADAALNGIGNYLERLAVEEPRLRYRFSGKPFGISMALNEAAGLAQGEYLAFLEETDVLSPLAFHWVTESLQNASPDVIYTDEDNLDQSGHKTHPSLKPDWSPDLLTSEAYWGHLLVIAHSRFKEFGGFRSDYDGACFYDAALRLSDRQLNIRHVPRILYHSRLRSLDLQGDAGHEKNDAVRRALVDTIRRREWNAEVASDSIPRTPYIRWNPFARIAASLSVLEQARWSGVASMRWSQCAAIANFKSWLSSIRGAAMISQRSFGNVTARFELRANSILRKCGTPLPPPRQVTSCFSSMTMWCPFPPTGSAICWGICVDPRLESSELSSSTRRARFSTPELFSAWATEPVIPAVESFIRGCGRGSTEPETSPPSRAPAWV